MPDPVPDFLEAFAPMLVGHPPDEGVGRALDALNRHFESYPHLVLEVQFTGFYHRDQRVGVVNPTALHAAGQLIVLHVIRLGFLPQVGEKDLRCLAEVLSRAPSDLPAGGAVAALRERVPDGVLVATSGGEAYRPPERMAPPPAAASEAGPEGEAGDQELEEEEGATLSFDLLDTPDDLAPPSPDAPPPAPAPSSRRGQTAPEEEEGGLFQLFRSTRASTGGEGAEAVADQLGRATNLASFDELAQIAARESGRLLEQRRDREAGLLLAALANAAAAGGRARLFRETALQALRGILRQHRVEAVLAALAAAEPERRTGFLALLLSLGDDTSRELEELFPRTDDPALRSDLLRALLADRKVADRVVSGALREGSPGRAASVLQAIDEAEVAASVAVGWLRAAVSHPSPEVRRLAAERAGRKGREGVRLLVDLLVDADSGVRRAAVSELAASGSKPAVPFLASFISAEGDESLQIAAVEAVGEIGGQESLTPLLAIIRKRQLFGGKRLARLKAAALEALAKRPTGAGRNALRSLAQDDDRELAARARTLLETTGVEKGGG